MHAIILAAGRGSRMGKATSSQPKCLTTIAGKSLLDWQLGALRAAELRQIALVRGYHAECLQPAGCKFYENPLWERTNMVATLACAEEWLGQHSCLVSYSDIVYHPQILGQLVNHSADLVVSYDQNWLKLWSERFTNPLADAETFRFDEKGFLTAIGGRAKALEEIEGQYMGLIKMTPKGWNHVRVLLNSLPPEETNQLDMTSMLQRLLNKNVQVAVTPINGRWCEVDHEKDLQIYEHRLASPDCWEHDWRWDRPL